MPDLLADGATWLAARLKASVSRTVTYRRGRTDYPDLTATHAAQDYTLQSTEGIVTNVRMDDFIWTADDLPVEPRQGDLILETVRGESRTFEVQPIGNKPCWELMGSNEVLAVVHTKRIA